MRKESDRIRICTVQHEIERIGTERHDIDACKDTISIIKASQKNQKSTQKASLEWSTVALKYIATVTDSSTIQLPI